MRTVALLLATALAAAACSAPIGEDPGDRVADVQAAREAYAGPATALGTAARTVADEVAEVRTEDAPAEERLLSIASIRDELLPELAAAARLVVAAPTAGPDVSAARRAWSDAIEAAEQLLESSRAALDRAELLAEVDRDLAAVVAEWDEAGSYSRQLERFAVARDTARAIAERVRGLEPSPECSDEVAHRQAAADHVAEASEELRVLVEERRGEEFGDRLRELEGAPYGGAAPGPVDAGCWNTSDVTTAAAAVAVSLDRLEATLNPSDLRTGP